MRILVSGAGPAGLAVTAALLDQGHQVTLIEKSPDLRAAGYTLNLHENGLEVVRRLGLSEAVQDAALPMGRAVYLDRRERPLLSYDCQNMLQALNGQLLVLPRDALIHALALPLRGRADLRFSTVLHGLHQHHDHVEADLGDGLPERFDLVIGADGLRSRVRHLAFPDAPAARDLGYSIAAWRVCQEGAPDASITGRMAVGRQALLYRLSATESAVSLCWKHPREGWSRDTAHAALSRSFADMPVIAALIRQARADEVYLDRIEQLSLPRCSKGRVVLIGDAASCGGFFSGQGSSLGLAGAWILAEELAQADHATAFARYEARMRPATDRMLKIGAAAARSFVPSGQVGLWLCARLAPVMMHRRLLPLMIRRTLPPRLFP